MAIKHIVRDPIDARRREYESRDRVLMEAIADMAAKLDANGVDIGQGMRDELTEREKIKGKYPNREKGKDARGR